MRVLCYCENEEEDDDDEERRHLKLQRCPRISPPPHSSPPLGGGQVLAHYWWAWGGGVRLESVCSQLPCFINTSLVVFAHPLGEELQKVLTASLPAPAQCSSQTGAQNAQREGFTWGEVATGQEAVTVPSPQGGS